MGVGVLDVVHSPPSHPITLDIVAVNGFYSHSYLSRTSDDTEGDAVTGLQDLLPVHVSSARIMVFSYHWGITPGDNVLSADAINQSGEDLLNDLHQTRVDSKTQEIPIIFLSHDLGGVVVKKALVLAAKNSKFFNVASNTRFVTFFGCPHRPVDLMSWDDLIFNIISKTKYPLSSVWNMTSQVRALSMAAENLSFDFISTIKRLRLLNVYQEPKTSEVNATIDIVVDRYSSTTDFVHETNIGRQISHQSLCKFTKNDVDLFAIMTAIKRETNQDYAECMSKLYSLTPPFLVPRDAIFQQQGSTKDSSTYSTWFQASSSSIIYLQSDQHVPNCVISGDLFRKLQRSNGGAAYYSFTEDHLPGNSATSLMISLILQILSQDSARFPTVQDLYLAIDKYDTWTNSAVWSLFRSLIEARGLDTFYLVINDIHNSDSSLTDFLRRLSNLLDQNLFTRLKIVILSQRGLDNGIVDCFASCLRDRIDDVALLQQWVSSYASYCVPRLMERNKSLQELRTDLETALWRCQDSLQLHLTLHAIGEHRPGTLRSLESIRLNLALLPCRARDIVPSVFEGLGGWARTALGWILNARRPLLLNELAVALIFSDLDILEAKKFAPEKLPLDLSTELAFAFGPLLKIKNDEIFFSHPHIHDYFRQVADEERQPQELDYDAFNRTRVPNDWDITQFLLKYLSSDELIEAAEEAREEGLWEIPRSLVFEMVHYAVQFWPDHYRKAESKGSYADEICKFLENRSLIHVWTELSSMLGCMHSPPDLCVRDPLSLAAQLGFESVISKLKNEKPVTGFYLDTAISMATWGGHRHVVLSLLEYVMKSTTYNLERSVKYASVRGYDEILDLLLEYIDTSTFVWDSELLCRAAELGYEYQVTLFISKGAAVDQTYEGTSPLQLAARNGHASIVHLLVRNGADVNSTAADDSRKPILLSSRNGHTSIASYLIEHDGPNRVDLTVSDINKRTALHLAAQNGHYDVLKLLLNCESAAAGINNRDDFERTPLMLACKNGHLSSVELLLECNAKIDLADQDLHTALYHAVFEDHEPIAKLVLKLAPPESKFNDIADIFVEAAKLGFVDVIGSCLDSGMITDANLRYCPLSDGRSALHYAAENGHLAVVTLLLERGVDADQPEGSTDSVITTTPLSLAALAGRAEVVDVLIKNHAKAKLVDETGWNILTQLAALPDSIVCNGHVRVAEILLDAKMDPNSIESSGSGRSALHLAAESENWRIAKTLLNNKANPKIKDNDGQNPLHVAAKTKSSDVAQLLISAGVDPHDCDNNDRTPMHNAAYCANIAVMKILWQAVPEIEWLNSKDYNGDSPLQDAYDSDTTTEWLLRHGAQVDLKNSSDRTALMIAARNGVTNVVNLLLSHGANPTLHDSEGWTALHHAAYWGRTIVAQSLLERDQSIVNKLDHEGHTPLITAISSSEPEFALWLLQGPDQASIELNIQDSDGNTALMLAVKKENEELVEHLLKLSAQTNLQNKSRETALLLAVMVKDPLWALKILIDHGAEIDGGGGPYPTALYVAAENGLEEVVKELIRLGANPNAPGGLYHTALTAASTAGYDEIVELLLESGARADMSGGVFSNAFSAALHSGADEIAWTLLDHGARINDADDQGRTSMHIAAWRDSWRTIESLLAKGGEISKRDKQGRTILHHAAARGNVEIVEIIMGNEEYVRDLDMEDNDGWDALHWACRNDENDEMIVFLAPRKSKSYLEKETNDNWTVKDIAIFHDAENLIPILLESIEPETNDTEKPMPENDESDERRIWKTGEDHWRVSCDGCGQRPIFGLRWRCEVCSNFDFCFKCYWTVSKTHPGHTFEKIGDGPERRPNDDLQ